MLVLLLFLLIPANSVAVTNTQSARHAWDTTYIFGSTVLCLTYYVIFDLDFKEAVAYTILSATAKEWVDHMYYKGMIPRSNALDHIFDPYRGFDGRDIGLSAIGITIAIPFHLKLRK